MQPAALEKIGSHTKKLHEYTKQLTFYDIQTFGKRKKNDDFESSCTKSKSVIKISTKKFESGCFEGNRVWKTTDSEHSSVFGYFGPSGFRNKEKLQSLVTK